eukprot:CAMPEP_0175252304 /NCGR_PEP_ID=MMETSP0093-20121207/36104_1 /TAXON_ID=311494 /ORGANISM="Alexandrium monilatum, Strain CCMP3105" /LENGTH=32 /DNA_ID= /DNA_START= /DNA_END= /DNA_ORIENTATION=
MAQFIQEDALPEGPGCASVWMAKFIQEDALPE